MRDVSHYPLTGYFNYDTTARRSRDVHLETHTKDLINNGYVRRGRSDLVYGDRLRATYNRGYDIKVKQAADLDIRQKSRSFFYDRSGATAPPSELIALNRISYPAYLPVVDYSTIGEARNSVLSKIQNQSWNAGQTIGEANSTLGGLRSAVVTGIRAAAAAKKGNFKKAAKILRGKGSKADVASNSYLAYQFGLKPLISDIQGALGDWDVLLGKDDLIKVRSTAVDSHQASDSGYWTASGAWECGCEIGVMYRVSEPDMLRASSLGLLNPAALAYELVPLSFVFDYFFSVGNFLTGLGSTIGCEFVSGYETTFARAKEVEYTNDYYPPRRNTGHAPSHKVTAFAMERTALSSFPNPRIVMNTDLNLNQLSTIMALAQQKAL